MYGDPGIVPADVLNLVGKVYPSAEVKTIRIAASAVMDSWVSGTSPFIRIFDINEMNYDTSQ
jgi:hypothetical protein